MLTSAVRAVRKHRSVAIASLMGFVLFIVASRIAWAWGPAQDGNFDSAFYLDGARHLARGEGYVSASVAPTATSFEPITHWAPGTSLLIAAVMRLGVSATQAASIVLGASYVVAVLGVYALGLSLAGASYWFASLVVSLVFALQTSTLASLAALLSDLPWASVALIDLLLALRLVSAQRPGIGLRIALGFGLAWLVLLRYAGLLFVPGLLTGVLLAMRADSRSLWSRALSLWPTLITCGAGIGLLSLRNQHSVDEPFGHWITAPSELAPLLAQAVTGCFAWYSDLTHLKFGPDAAITRGVLWSAGLCLVPLLAASRRAWRDLSFIVAPCASYFVLMIATASMTVIATLDHTRFWIPLWPMVLLLGAMACVRAQGRLLWVFKLGLAVGGLWAFGLFALNAYRQAPDVQLPRGLLDARWARASAILPAPERCRLFVLDPRPFMMHRTLGPTSQMPATLAEFDAAAQRHANVCIAISDKRLRLSTTAEQRRPAQIAVVAALKDQQRLSRVAQAAGVTVYELQKPPTL